MKKSALSASVIALSLMSSGANAVILRFTATSAAAGQLGYFTIDDDKLHGWPEQWVPATDFLELRFQDPLTHFLVTTPGAGSAIIDSSGYFTVVHIPPTVVGSTGDVGGDGFNGSVWFVDNNKVLFFTGDFDHEPFFIPYNDVTWTAKPVPEPASWAMMIGGFGLLGAALRRRSTAVRFA